MMASMEREWEVAEAKAQAAERERHRKKLRAAGVADDGRLRWYRLTFSVDLVRNEAKMPKVRWPHILHLRASLLRACRSSAVCVCFLRSLRKPAKPTSARSTIS